GRKRSDVAQQWIHELVRAIRQEDKRCLITVGLVPWSLDRPGLSSGFVPDAIAGELDFISVHLYPDKMKEKEAIETLRGFSVGKPVLIEETFPLKCSVEELSDFIHESRKYACGWIGFYWGRTIGECRESKEIRDALTVGWLEFFQREARKGSNPGQQ